MIDILIKQERIKIYTNESVSVAIAEGLKRRGVSVQSCQDAGNCGLTDEQQLDYAWKNSFVIFTHYDDFLKLSAEYMDQEREHAGIIYSHQKDYSLGGMHSAYKAYRGYIITGRYDKPH
ncbi:hypothetical protein GF312_11625 [Candidatus Poribacteria bacterium]|nr:hypothetical protein [Candidatus Poribacteria bacterium]